MADENDVYISNGHYKTRSSKLADEICEMLLGVVFETGPEQSMKIDDRKTNRSIDDNR